MIEEKMMNDDCGLHRGCWGWWCDRRQGLKRPNVGRTALKTGEVDVAPKQIAGDEAGCHT